MAHVIIETAPLPWFGGLGIGGHGDWGQGRISRYKWPPILRGNLRGNIFSRKKGVTRTGILSLIRLNSGKDKDA